MSQSPVALPSWASELAEQYFGGTLIEFIVHGNVNDKVEADDGQGGRSYVSLRRFLARKLFPRRDAVIFYDPSAGVSFRDDATGLEFHEVTRALDAAQGTTYSKSGLPRDAGRALYLIEKFMRAMVDPRGGKPAQSVALVIEYADLILPAGDPSHLSLSQQSTLVTLLRWARDPVFLDANLTVVLVAENPAQLNKTLVEVCDLYHPGLSLLGYLFTKADSTVNSRTSLQVLRDTFGSQVFNTIIPRNVALKNASFNKQDIFAFDPTCKGAHAYKRLIEEVLL